jgi:hypothetical protein
MLGDVIIWSGSTPFEDAGTLPDDAFGHAPKVTAE